MRQHHFGSQSWLAPLLTPAELRQSDRYAIEARGIPGIELMRRAGAALAQVAATDLPDGRIVVVCGPGNNGGDGFIAAQVLHDAGRDVTLAATRSASGYSGDAALALAACTLPVEQMSPHLLRGATGAIDALLGTGASGAPRGAEGEAVAALLASGLPVVACDVPSGVGAADGQIAGDAIRAVCTVTFHRPSAGLVVHPGKTHAGRVVVADIGIPVGAAIDPAAGTIRDAVVRALPSRDAGSHKYNAGAVLIAAGSAGYPGAAALAVRGAQRGGAGYVTAFVSPQTAGSVRHLAPEAIVRDWAAGAAAFGELLESRADAVVLGPGLADRELCAELWERVREAPVPLVLDADAIAVAAGHPAGLRRSAPLVITPHAGELGRLLGRSSSEIAAGRLVSAREAAAQSGAFVVLKGDDTIIAAPDGSIAVNDLAAPALATAGTGDVLAGLTGALLAAGAAPALAAAAAVRIHARAGRVAAARCGGVDGVVAWDVAEAIPGARNAGAV